MADPAALAQLARLVDVMHRLRAPGGCPWDREQTPRSLRPFVIEEAYEVIEAIDHGDPGELCLELGDLLLQVVFQAELASERGDFHLGDVACAIADKLERRHPHVFGDATVRDAGEVVRNWQRLKAQERAARGHHGVLAGVPGALPALARAQAVGDKLGRVGFDWPDAAAVLEKLDEERAELDAAMARGDRDGAGRELGDVLLTLTSLARHLGVDAETALREATGRLVGRVDRVEAAVTAAGGSLEGLAADERDRLWDQAKAAEPPHPGLV